MKIKELIEKLKEYDQELEVFACKEDEIYTPVLKIRQRLNDYPFLAYSVEEGINCLVIEIT